VAGDDGDAQDGEHERPREIDRDDEEPAIHAVGQDAGVQPEQQPRQPLEQPARRHEQRVLGLRGDQQRTGRQADPVAEVADPRRADEPAEGGPHAGGEQRLERSTSGHAALRIPDNARAGRPDGGSCAAREPRRVLTPSPR
jgi:hypothetical protein